MQLFSFVPKDRRQIFKFSVAFMFTETGKRKNILLKGVGWEMENIT